MQYQYQNAAEQNEVRNKILKHAVCKSELSA